MNNSTTETTRVSFDRKIDSFANGELEHATEMLSTLWRIVNTDGEIKAPPNTSPTVSPFRSFFSVLRGDAHNTLHDQTVQVTSPAHWATVKIALINSIGKGVFFDRKYWARHSKAGDGLKPVYFSSIVIGDKVQQLNNCASKFIH